MQLSENRKHLKKISAVQPPFHPNRPISQLGPMCTVGEQPVQAGEGWPEPAAGGGWQAAARYAAVPGGTGCRARGREGGVGAQAQHLPPNHQEVRGETFYNHILSFFLPISWFLIIFKDPGDAFSRFSDKTGKCYILMRQNHHYRITFPSWSRGNLSKLCFLTSTFLNSTKHSTFLQSLFVQYVVNVTLLWPR